MSRLTAESWVFSLSLIRAGLASTLVNGHGHHTLEIVTTSTKYRKPALGTATWVNARHLKVALSHRELDSVVSGILACSFRPDAPSHFHVGCRAPGTGAEVTLTFEFPDEVGASR